MAAYAASARRRAAALGREVNPSQGRAVLQKMADDIRRHAGGDPKLVALAEELEQDAANLERIDSLDYKRLEYTTFGALRSKGEDGMTIGTMSFTRSDPEPDDAGRAPQRRPASFLVAAVTTDKEATRLVESAGNVLAAASPRAFAYFVVDGGARILDPGARRGPIPGRRARVRLRHGGRCEGCGQDRLRSRPARGRRDVLTGTPERTQRSSRSPRGARRRLLRPRLSSRARWCCRGCGRSARAGTRPSRFIATPGCAGATLARIRRTSKGKSRPAISARGVGSSSVRGASTWTSSLASSWRFTTWRAARPARRAKDRAARRRSYSGSPHGATSR